MRRLAGSRTDARPRAAIPILPSTDLDRTAAFYTAQVEDDVVDRFPAQVGGLRAAPASEPVAVPGEEAGWG